MLPFGNTEHEEAHRCQVHLSNLLVMRGIEKAALLSRALVDDDGRASLEVFVRPLQPSTAQPMRIIVKLDEASPESDNV